MLPHLQARCLEGCIEKGHLPSARPLPQSRPLFLCTVVRRDLWLNRCQTGLFCYASSADGEKTHHLSEGRVLHLLQYL